MQRIQTLAVSLLVTVTAMPWHAGLQAQEPTALAVRFAEPGWDGTKVPDGRQCQRFGGGGPSPSLIVTGIPATANALVVEFSDRSFKPMDQGGHGKIGYSLPAGAAGGEVKVPSVAAHTLELPEGFFVVAEHKAPNWDKAGAYLPPCSGGRGNAYYLTVKAVHKTGEEVQVLAQADLEMGKF